MTEQAKQTIKSNEQQARIEELESALAALREEREQLLQENQTLLSRHSSASAAPNIGISAIADGLSGRWQPIATAPKVEIVDFWIVPKLPEESYTDTSGKPMSHNCPPQRHTGRLKTWGATWKATHWMPLPSPPTDQLPSADARPTDSEEGTARGSATESDLRTAIAHLTEERDHWKRRAEDAEGRIGNAIA